MCNYQDPFGLCTTPTGEFRKCTVTALGNANLATLRPEARKSLVMLAQLADHDLGVTATTNGNHSDPRHKGTLSGLAVDIGTVDGYVVGTSAAAAAAVDVATAAESMASVEKVIAPDRFKVTANGRGFGSKRVSVGSFVPGDETYEEHRDHLHVAFFSSEERQSVKKNKP